VLAAAVLAASLAVAVAVAVVVAVVVVPAIAVVYTAAGVLASLRGQRRLETAFPRCKGAGLVRSRGVWLARATKVGLCAQTMCIHYACSLRYVSP